MVCGPDRITIIIKGLVSVQTSVEENYGGRQLRIGKGWGEEFQ